jgi:hypothetical protein
MTTVGVPAGATVFGYRGGLYEAPILGDGWVGLSPNPGEEVAERFPDAIEVGENAAVGNWVKVPRSTLESAFRREVTARWQGVPVEVVQAIRTGPRAGRMLVGYRGDSGAEAASTGFQGSDYGGWEASVEPSELSEVNVEMIEIPVRRT